MKPTLHKLSLTGSLMLSLSAAMPANADSLDKPLFSISGFGTVGVAHSSEDNADYTSSIFKPNGVGHTREWSADVDSRLGVQFDLNVTRQLSAVLQVVSEQRYDNSYKPTVEWANVKYQVTPDFSVRAGRVVLGNFMVSDYRKVGYASHWIRPPGEVYGMSQVTSSDGIDVSYRLRLGGLNNTVQSYYGRKNIRTTFQGSIVEGRNLFGLTNTMDYGAASVRLGYYQGRVSMPAISPLFDAFRMFGPRGVEIAEQYDLDNKPNKLVTAGASYDPGNWFLMAEYATQETNSWLGDRAGWYVSGGYRINQFTPYFIYSQVRPDSPSSDPGVPTRGLPPRLAATATYLNSSLNAILGAFTADQKAIAIGGRWDFAKNAALKVQYDHINMDSGSQGPLFNLQPGFVRGGKVNLFSVALDFVF